MTGADGGANPHLTTPVMTYGAAPAEAPVTVVVVHGRDQDPEWMLDHLVVPLDRPWAAYVLPAAEGRSWYPGSFLEGVRANQPRAGWALERLELLLLSLRKQGVDPGRTVLAGFSQGACVLAELLGGWSGTLGGAALLTGGFFGRPGQPVPQPLLMGVPILVATSAIDELVPVERVRETSDALRDGGAAVDLHVFPDRAHEISPTEVALLGGLLDRVRGHQAKVC